MNNETKNILQFAVVTFSIILTSALTIVSCFSVFRGLAEWSFYFVAMNAVFLVLYMQQINEEERGYQGESQQELKEENLVMKCIIDYLNKERVIIRTEYEIDEKKEGRVEIKIIFKVGKETETNLYIIDKKTGKVIGKEKLLK